MAHIKKKVRRPSLKKALANVESSPDMLFGNISIDLSSLPCLSKVPKEKITANFDADVIEAIRDVANQHQISYSTLMNDVLRKIFIENKKVS